MVTAFRTKKTLENWAFKVEKFVIIECQIYRLSVAFLVVKKKLIRLQLESLFLRGCIILAMQESLIKLCLYQNILNLKLTFSTK